MSRGVASRGCVVWASAVGVAPCGPSLVGVVWARPVLYCIVLGGPGTRGLALGAARALCCGAAYNMLCYVMLCLAALGLPRVLNTEYSNTRNGIICEV